MGDDQLLSQRIIDDWKEAAEHWKALEPLANDLTSIVEEYRGLIDGASTVFGVVGYVWNIYSSMEKAREEAARRHDMIQQITRAVDGMISRAVTDVKHYMDTKEVEDVIKKSNAAQQSFVHDVLPYANTFPLSGAIQDQLGSLMYHAREPIETMHSMIEARAKIGDGAACIILYRNLHAIVQCKLMMDKWLHGITPAVLEQAEYETSRLIQRWGSSEGNVAGGLMLQSDLAFSPGIVHFHVGGDGRPELSKYYYTYQGKSQASGPNLAPVQQAFIDHRKKARNEAFLVGEVQEWSVQAYKTWKQTLTLQGQGD